MFNKEFAELFKKSNFIYIDDNKFEFDNGNFIIKNNEGRICIYKTNNVKDEILNQYLWNSFQWYFMEAEFFINKSENDIESINIYSIVGLKQFLEIVYHYRTHENLLLKGQNQSLRQELERHTKTMKLIKSKKF